MSNCHENQKDNYGLYALKCSRNAAKRTGIIMNITTSNDLNQNLYEIKHEQFHPCQSVEKDVHCVNYAREDREFYKIEFNEEGVPNCTENKRTVRASPTVQIEKSALKKATIGQATISDEAYKCIDGKIIENVTRGKSIAPVLPRRLKNYVRKPIVAIPSSRDSSSGPDEKPSPVSQSSNSKHIPPAIPYKLHQRIVSGPLPLDMAYTALSAPSIELQKNDNQLYRLSAVKETQRFHFEDQHQTSLNHLKPIKGGTDVHRTLPPTNKRHSSSDDSVNIFRSKNTENMFDDFDEIFLDEPVHHVEILDELSKNDTTKNDKTAFNYCLNKTRVGFASAKKLSRKKLFRRSDQSKSQKKFKETNCSSSSPHLSLENSNDIDANTIERNSYHDINNDNAITNDDGSNIDAEHLKKRTSITDNFIKHSARGDYCRHDDYNYYNDDCNHDINFNDKIEYYSQLNKYNENIVTV